MSTLPPIMSPFLRELGKLCACLDSPIHFSSLRVARGPHGITALLPESPPNNKDASGLSPCDYLGLRQIAAEAGTVMRMCLFIAADVVVVTIARGAGE